MSVPAGVGVGGVCVSVRTGGVIYVSVPAGGGGGYRHTYVAML